MSVLSHKVSYSSTSRQPNPFCVSVPPLIDTNITLAPHRFVRVDDAVRRLSLDDAM